MGKRRRESDSDGATATVAEFNTVFVDTSIDTHLAMLVSDSDTVSDFRKKIALEHMKCFPAVGEIQIQSLKVQRKSNFYHLPDIMLVWSAFQGEKGDWFLSVDASTVVACHLNQHSCELGTSDRVRVKDAGDCRGLSSDINRMELLSRALPNDAHESNDIPGMTAGIKFEKSLERTIDINRDTCLEENCVETKPRAKKKQKMRQTEDMCHHPSVGDSCTLLHASSDARNNQSKVEVAAENCDLDSDKGKKEDTTALVGIARENIELECEPGQDCPTESLVVISNAVPDRSTRSRNGTDVKKDVKSDGNKRKKKRTSKMAAEVCSQTYMEQTGKGENTKLCVETHMSEEKEGEKDLSLNHDQDVATPSHKKSLDIAVSNLEQKGSFSPPLLDAPAVGEPDIYSGNKKKRKKKNENKNKKTEGGKKPINANQGISSASGLISPSNHNQEASGKEESTLQHKGQGVQMNDSCKDAGEEVQDAEENGVEFVVSTQNSQTLEEVASVEKIVQKNAQISLGGGHEGFFPIGEVHTADFNQVDKNGENQENKDRKAKKKRKRVQLSVSDVKMKDADYLGLTSDVSVMEAVQMAIPNNDGEKNNVSSDVKKDQLNVEATAKTGNFGSDRSKENIELEGMMPENVLASKLGRDVPTESWGISSNQVPDCSTRLMDSSGAVEDITSKSDKRKKKKTNKMAAKSEDKTGVEEGRKGGNTELYIQSRKPEENDEEKSFPLRHDCEVTIPSNKNYSEVAVPNPAHKESKDAHAVVTCDISNGTNNKNKKGRKGKNSADTNLEKSGIEQPNNYFDGSSGLIYPSADHIPEASDKEESTLNHKQQDAPMKLLKCSSNDASEKALGANGNGVDLIVSTQTTQILEDVASAERIVDKRTQSSIEKDQIMGFNEVEKSGDNKENKDRKAKKKRKNVKHAATDVTEHLPVKVQEAGVEVPTTEGNLDNLVIYEKKNGHVASSAAVSIKSEEKVDEKNRTTANTSDLERTENCGERCKDSGNVEKKAYKSNSKKIGRVESNDLPPTSTSLELHYSHKSSENQESGHQSQGRKTSGKRWGDSNSQHDEVLLNSSRTSPTLSGIEAIPSEMQQRETPQKPVEKSAYLKSRGIKKVQTGVNAANQVMMNTLQKKSLLSTQGSIFQDNNGESSGDENETVCSESSAHSPSDSSSLSRDSESVGERDVSQDPTRNGSDDAKDQSAGGKNSKKLDLYDSQEITMEMILRSSKRFKKAKLLASQNELEDDSQPLEFVPDNQPIESVPESQLI